MFAEKSSLIAFSVSFLCTIHFVHNIFLLTFALHVAVLREVHKEASQAREKASELKLRRQEQVAARREKLKQAYLRKQLEKLKASKAEQT